jgi:hypothetical protein
MMTVHFHSVLFVYDSAMQLTIHCMVGRRKHSSGSHLNEILRAPSSRSFQPSSKISLKKGVRSALLRLIFAAKPAAVGTGVRTQDQCKRGITSNTRDYVPFMR